MNDKLMRAAMAMTAHTHTSTHSYPTRDLIQCAEREARARRIRYANKVLTRRMTQHEADAEIDKMDAIAQVLSEIEERERLL